MFNINEFRAALKFGGARTSHFHVRMTNPVNTDVDQHIHFYCKAAPLPASSITPLEVSYFGRPIKLPGNRTFDNWNVTIINDEDFRVKNALEHWQNAINGLETNIRKMPSSETSLVKSTAEVIQLSKTGELLRSYKLIGLWPTTVSQIDMTWDNDAIEEFTVDFAYDYWIIGESTTGDGGGI